MIDIFQGATVSAIVEASQLPLSIGWLPNYYWDETKKCHGKYFESDLDEKLVDLAYKVKKFKIFGEEAIP